MNEQEFTQLANASRRAAALTLLGVVIIVGSLLYATANLYRSQEQLEENRVRLEQYTVRLSEMEIAEKEKTVVLRSLNERIAQAQERLDRIKNELEKAPSADAFASIGNEVQQLEKSITAADIDTRIALELPGLIEKMNDVAKSERTSAVQQLVTNYKTEPLAVEQAVTMLELPKLDDLSAQGRINVLYFLRHTESSAWNPHSVLRAKSAIDTIQKRDESKVAQIGPKTQKELEELSAYLNQLDQL